MAENKGPGRLHAYLASYSGSEEPLMRLLPARPYIELSSNAKMLVEGCTGILEYERECIRLTAGKWVLRITGSGLQIGSISEFGGIADENGSALPPVPGDCAVHR